MSSPVSTFSFPTTTLFGPGTIGELPARLQQFGSKRPLVVTDSGMLETGAFASLQRAIEGAHGLRWEVFSGVHPNPVDQDVVLAAKAFVAHNCDAVIAFGG